MNTRGILIASLCTAVACGLILLAVRSQGVLETGLPPRAECSDPQAAWSEAARFSREFGGSVVLVLGTGSMAPYIPAARRGLDPLTTPTALAVTDPSATFESVTAGQVCLYRHAASAVGLTMHGAALRTDTGWIMSGLNNPTSDINMTAENFVGVVARTFVWPQ